MKFRIILKRNLNTTFLAPTYFKTKKNATIYASQFDDAIIQKKVASKWVDI